jgi:hypothetical protein
MSFCEERVCAWIREPANTWSNVAYLLVGAGLVRAAVREGRRDLLAIGATELCVFVGSFLFHASGAFVGEVLDVAAMMVFAWLMLAQNAARLFSWNVTNQSRAWILGSATSCALLVAVRDIGVPLFALVVVLAFALEIRNVRTRGMTRAHRDLLYMVGTFAIAWGAWWLDVLRVPWACDPSRHWFSGHAVWHVVNSVCFLFLYRFYRGASDATLLPRT